MKKLRVGKIRDKSFEKQQADIIKNIGIKREREKFILSDVIFKSFKTLKNVLNISLIRITKAYPAIPIFGTNIKTNTKLKAASKILTLMQ